MTDLADQGRETPIAMARRLIAAARFGALATLTTTGYPFSSLVLLAADADGRPLMLLSDLAVHTGHLKVDARVGLMIDGAAGPTRDLTEPRLSLTGRAGVVEDAAALDLFLARHDSARTYAGFGDFRLYAITPTAGHLVAGFGAIHSLTAADLQG